MQTAVAHKLPRGRTGGGNRWTGQHEEPPSGKSRSGVGSAGPTDREAGPDAAHARQRDPGSGEEKILRDLGWRWTHARVSPAENRSGCPC
jgi:hypothetical protein